MTEPIRARILIEGRLQAMNFRFNTQRQAKKLELTGFVRTLSDGRIEIEAQGEQNNIEKLLAWCQEEPQSSQIRSILYRYDEPKDNYTDFEVR
ncbi:MAG: acylphosphatase [Anaerolineae bacterium]|nr:acylphosphatase [Anaerolineae bacterium]